jgi:C-terminal domain 7 of the ABC-three component (ABC-3C) systems/Cap4, dsDNA endonuclease domain
MAGHSAAASAVGYLYQTNWALVDLLRKGHTRPDQAITLELHDDVAWTAAYDTADPVELLQVKLHTTSRAAGVGDMAVDIWKTIRVWMDRSDLSDPQGPELALVTTSVATEGTAAYALRPSTRDVALASERLMKAAQDSTNEDTQGTRDAFVALDPYVRNNLLNRVRVLDAQMPPEDLDVSVREALAYALPTGGRHVENRFVAQVWHYWAAVAIDMLTGKRASVSVTEVRTYVRELRNSYTTENLPTTVPLSSVTEKHVQLYVGAHFVKQLNLIDYAGPSLRNAIIDYHRAVTQETEWLSDSLLDIQELRRFEEELRFEWTREFSNMVQDLELDHLSPEDAEEVKRRAGRKLVNYLLNSTAVTVRAHYNEGFYGRGKRHELAGHRDVTQRIGWHPDFVERLEALAVST